jgi:hypothetical protein
MRGEDVPKGKGRRRDEELQGEELNASHGVSSSVCA